MGLRKKTGASLIALTRADLSARVLAGTIKVNSLYFISDEGKIAVGRTTTTFVEGAAGTVGGGTPTIILTGSSVAESSPIATTIGTLAVQNGSGTWTFSRKADPDSKFSVSGANLNLAAALDYETKTQHSVTISATNGTTTIEATFPINVLNVIEGTLAPSSAGFTAGVAAGTLITTISGLDAGANEKLSSVSPNDGRLTVNADNTLRVGDTIATAGTIAATVYTTAGRNLPITVTVAAAQNVPALIQKGIDLLGFDFRTTGPTATPTKVPGVDALPAGATLDTNNKFVRIAAGATVVLDGWDFSANGGWMPYAFNDGGDITISNCKMGAKGAYLVGGNKYLVQNCDFDGQKLSTSGDPLTTLSNKGQTILKRNRFHGGAGDACKPASNCTLIENYFYDMGYNTGAHADHTQIAVGVAVQNVTFSRNLFDGTSYGQPVGLNNAIRAIAELGGALDTIVIDSNIVVQPGNVQPPFAIGNRTDSQPGTGCANVTVKDNFIRMGTSTPVLASAAPDTGLNYWVNNKNLDTGAAMAAPTGYASSFPVVSTARYMLAGTRMTMPGALTSPADSQLSRISRMHTVSPDYETKGYRFVFANSYVDGTGTATQEFDNENSVTIDGASVEIGGNFYPVTFGGQSSVVIPAGGHAVSDALASGGNPVVVAARTPMKVRTSDTVLSGQKRIGGLARQAGNSEGCENTAAPQTAKLTSGTVGVANTGGTSMGLVYGPCAAVAQGWDGRPVVLMMGDSILAGANDAGVYVDDSGCSGYGARGFDSITGGAQRYAHLNWALTGSRPSQTSDRNAGHWRRRAQILDSLKALNTGGAQPFTVIYSGHINNDAGGPAGNTGTALKATMQAYWDFVKSEFPGIRLIQATPAPNAQDPTDYKWSDYEHQVVSTANDRPAAGMTDANARWVTSDWIKTKPAPLDGVIDLASFYAGDNPNSMKWRTRPFASTVTADFAAGGTTIQMADKPEVGELLLINPGNTVRNGPAQVSAVTGTGPYTVNFNNAPLSNAYAAGTVVRGVPSNDGTHPSSRVQKEAAEKLIVTAKLAGVFSGTVASTGDPNRLMVAATRFANPTGAISPTDSQLVRNSKEFFVTPDYPISGLQLAFVNWYVDGLGAVPTENDIGNALKIEGACLKIGSNVYPITFNGGAASATIADGGNVICDPILSNGAPLVIPAGTSCFVITVDSVASGQKKPGGTVRQNPNGEFIGNAAAVDSAVLTSGNVANANNTGTGMANPYGPIIGIAKGWDGRPVGLGVGDSIAAAQNDSSGILTPRGANGYVARGMESNNNGTKRLPFANFCVTGTRAENMSTRDAGAFRRRGELFDAIKALNGGKDPFTFIYCEHSANSSGDIKGKLQTLWAFLKAQFPGVRLIQNSAHPNAQDTSNNKWTDPLAQTVAAANARTDPLTATQARWFASDYFLTVPAPLDAAVDTTPLTCDPTLRDRWRARDFTATVVAANTAGGTTITIDNKPELYETLIIEPGTSAVQNCTVTAVTGDGPYVVTTAVMPAVHPVGSVIRTAMTTDGVHIGIRGHIDLGELVNNAKISGKFGTGAVA